MHDPRSPITVIPLTLPSANAIVGRIHRHHGPIPGGFGWWSVAAVADGRIVGAAIAGAVHFRDLVAVIAENPNTTDTPMSLF